ncbi:MAG: NAD(P)H-binding protein [bacterium]
MTKAFVAGATGYTGREVVRLLREADVEVTAHIRPDSSSRAKWEGVFAEQGAHISTAAWNLDAISEALATASPDLVFALLGTTRARKDKAENRDAETYEAVDYGLTAMLIDACVACGTSPGFVYLSSLGVTGSSPSAYIQARWKAEQKLRTSGLRYVIARPAFISGDNRDESRPLERIGAVSVDVGLGLLGALGMKKLQAKYASMDNTTLAKGLVNTALAGLENQEVEPDALRSAAED